MKDASEIVIDVKARALERPKFSLVSNRFGRKGTVFLLLDHSSSMADGQKLLQLKRGALRFFAEAYARDYAVGIIGFANRAKCYLGATRNFYLFQKRLNDLFAGGNTAMTAALRLGGRKLRWRKGYRALFLITDGQPKYKENALLEAKLLRAKGIDIIAVGTVGADETFLQALHPKSELVNVSHLAEHMTRLGKALPKAK